MATEHFNKLTEAEQERLVILAEECAEVIQVVAKIQRHGFNSDNTGTMQLTNRRLLENEIGHVNYAVSQLALAADVDFSRIHRAMDAKAVHIRQYLHHQPQPESIRD